MVVYRFELLDKPISFIKDAVSGTCKGIFNDMDFNSMWRCYPSEHKDTHVSPYGEDLYFETDMICGCKSLRLLHDWFWSQETIGYLTNTNNIVLTKYTIHDVQMARVDSSEIQTVFKPLENACSRGEVIDKKLFEEVFTESLV